MQLVKSVCKSLYNVITVIIKKGTVALATFRWIYTYQYNNCLV